MGKHSISLPFCDTFLLWWSGEPWFGRVPPSLLRRGNSSRLAKRARKGDEREKAIIEKGRREKMREIVRGRKEGAFKAGNKGGGGKARVVLLFWTHSQGEEEKVESGNNKDGGLQPSRKWSSALPSSWQTWSQVWLSCFDQDHTVKLHKIRSCHCIKEYFFKKKSILIWKEFFSSEWIAFPQKFILTICREILHFYLVIVAMASLHEAGPVSPPCYFLFCRE